MQIQVFSLHRVVFSLRRVVIVFLEIVIKIVIKETSKILSMWIFMYFIYEEWVKIIVNKKLPIIIINNGKKFKAYSK